MNIHTMNEHPNMQANKLNAKYHLHVQHLTDVKTLKLLHQGYKIQQGHKNTKEDAQHNPKVINSYKAKVHNNHSLNY